MSSLNLILNSAVSGLATSQTAIAVTSQNVTNANTVGYSRQSVQLQQRVIGTTSNGVEIAGIARTVDVFLTRELRTASADAGAASARDDLYRQIVAQFGSPGSDSSLANDVARFGTAVDRLAINPEDPALRFDVVATGSTLARKTRQAAADIQNLRGEADRQIGVAVAEANEHLRTIFDLNRKIAQATATGEQAPDLEDQRDQAILKLSRLIGISTFTRENGEVAVFSGGGHALVDVQLRQLSYTRSATVGATTTFGAITVAPVDRKTLAPIGDAEVIVSAGLSATVVSDLDAGRIHGLLAMRDIELPALGAQLEAFAANLRDAVNAVHNDGTAFPAPNALGGTRAVAGGDAFAGTGTVRIAVLDANGAVVGAPLDLDLGALGATTIDNVIIAINAALGADGSASIVDGKLVIAATNPVNGIALNEGDSTIAATGRGFSHHFGLNDFFVGADALSLAVRAEIVADPSRVATADLSTTATTGQIAATVGDNRVAARLAEVFETAIPFSAVGGLPAADVTFGSFAATVIGLAATRASAAGDDVDQQATLVESLEFRLGAQSGVNVDEELSNLILFQNAYQASARVMTVAQQLFDTLIDMVR